MKGENVDLYLYMQHLERNYFFLSFIMRVPLRLSWKRMEIRKMLM